MTEDQTQTVEQVPAEPAAYPATPRAVAYSLVGTCALDETARQTAEGDSPPPNWEMYRSLTAALESWHKGGTLRQNSLVLTEWLAVDLAAYLYQQIGDRVGLQQWLLEFGDQVCRAQQHDHPAGPIAVEILSAVADDVDVPASKAVGDQRLARIGVPYLLYLRGDHEVEDAREMALTFALWAGAHLAELMHYEAERITAYLNARDAGRETDAAAGGTAP